MKFSTKSTYGVRAVFDLALHYNRGPVSVGAISKREDISVPYLEQILSKLRKKGLVKSIRGPTGGYVLARRPRDIRVGDVIRALEGEISPVFCTVPKNKKYCNRVQKCATRLLWKKLKDKMDDVLDSTTFGDLCAEAKKLGIEDYPEHSFTFNI